MYIGSFNRKGLPSWYHMFNVFKTYNANCEFTEKLQKHMQQ